MKKRVNKSNIRLIQFHFMVQDKQSNRCIGRNHSQQSPQANRPNQRIKYISEGNIGAIIKSIFFTVRKYYQ